MLDIVDDAFYLFDSSMFCCRFFFQAEDGIRDLVRSRGLGDVYKRQGEQVGIGPATLKDIIAHLEETYCQSIGIEYMFMRCLLYTSDAADERSSVDLGGRRIIKKKKTQDNR